MGSWKLETDMAAGALPQFLRELARALEAGKGSAEFSNELDGLPRAGVPGGLRKLVLVAELKAGRQSLKLKAKRADEQPTSAAQLAEQGAATRSSTHSAARPSAFQAKPQGSGKASDASARARDKYRQLKKALQADFKALHKAAEAGAVPSQDLLESFLALGESMAEMEQPVRGPGGAELAKANAAYLEDARCLRRAVSGRDAAALAEVLARLERRKSACHAQFK